MQDDIALEDFGLRLDYFFNESNVIGTEPVYETDMPFKQFACIE